MSSKVLLPKNVAEAIGYYRESGEFDFPTQAIMKVAMENVRYIGDPDKCNVIKRYVDSVDNLDTLMRALVIGYEVEKTPEDKVREYVTGLIRMRDGKDRHPEDSKMDHCAVVGAMQVLEYLNIKISGVNAE